MEVKEVISILYNLPTRTIRDIDSLEILEEFILQQDIIINKLKCCGNCKHALTMSQMGLEDTRPCKDCVNESLWEMED